MEIEALVAAHQPNLFAFLYRMCGDPALAEELVQEVFLRALRAADRYRPQGKISTWLYRIASNVVRDHWRQQQRRPTVPLTEWAPPPDPSAEAEALANLDALRVRRALLDLPHQQRSALILRYYHDLSYQEIAEALVIPLGTVRSRLHNGLARLRDELHTEVSLGG